MTSLSDSYGGSKHIEGADISLKWLRGHDSDTAEASEQWRGGRGGLIYLSSGYEVTLSLKNV